MGLKRRTAIGAGVVLAGIALALPGCGGSDQPTQSAEGPAGDLRQLPPGKVPHAAPSNAHKEIPTRFGRAISLPYRSTVLYAMAIDAVDPLEEHTSGGTRAVGVVLGLRNIGTSGWRGSVAGLSRLAVSPDGRPEDIVESFGSSAGPCPSPPVKSRAPVGNKPLSFPPGRTAFECVRFRLPRGENPILFKFATQEHDYTLAAEENGRVYAVWALPGTLVEKCRFEPSSAPEGSCQGLEDDEG